MNLKSTFSLSSFTFIKRLFSYSLLSAIRVVSSAYLRLLIFLLAILNPGLAPKASCLILFVFLLPMLGISLPAATLGTLC